MPISTKQDWVNLTRYINLNHHNENLAGNDWKKDTLWIQRCYKEQGIYGCWVRGVSWKLNLSWLTALTVNFFFFLLLYGRSNTCPLIILAQRGKHKHLLIFPESQILLTFTPLFFSTFESCFFFFSTPNLLLRFPDSLCGTVWFFFKGCI